MNAAPSLAPAEPVNSPHQPVGDAFNRIAADYDKDFTESLIGRLQREQVWRRIHDLFPAGGRILDLGCGTGADAIHLARQGFQVHAVDASTEMIVEAQRQIAATGLAEKITIQSVAIEQTWDRQSCLSSPPLNNTVGREGSQEDRQEEDRQDCLSHPLFDGAISNFGALNCVEELRPVAMKLSHAIPPGGRLALCFISRFCLWETFAYGFQGKFGKAARRWSNGGNATASLNGSAPFPVYYRPVREIIRAFEPEFQLTRRSGIGIFVPPTHLEAAVQRMPKLTKLAARIDQAVSAWPVFRAVADHTLLIFTRKHKL
jgi:SAM-dependent methyltransferase